MNKLIEVKNLSFAYDEKPVLKNISLSIEKGEKVAVMGNNGAGKSTFFLNLNGVMQPLEGEIFYDGIKIDKKRFNELRRKVGFVFQDADSQLIASNVRAEISFGPMNMGLNRAEVEKRVSSAIEYMELNSLKDRPPHYLSGGEKKRVTIADILAMKTEVLIFDEPMASLDPINAQNVEHILTRLHQDGKTLLIATHDVDFTYRFADRIVVFVDGEIIADGKPDEIFKDKAVMWAAHLKMPALMEMWVQLEQNGLVSGACPKTPALVAKAICLQNKQ